MYIYRLLKQTINILDYMSRDFYSHSDAVLKLISKVRRRSIQLLATRLAHMVVTVWSSIINRCMRALSVIGILMSLGIIAHYNIQVAYLITLGNKAFNVCLPTKK